MSSDDRVAVKTYVPRHQKREWVSHAEQLDMTQSEFVRTMVQAGRADIGVPGATDVEPLSGESSDDASVSNESAVGRSDFGDRIVEVLRRRGALDWDELVSALVDDVESELDDALQSLQSENTIVYSGRNGGYTLTNDE
ncbi:DUF5805 domain-containing protein [Halovivax cerinus]|uniref:DUF5805 domain-containing protein n=1 Tax=Halovivax cerinus TaxID=1487865 RepID=A0ABD5NT18_9EURY|nr:DUF5805 domain-containing protein [Halovivax cerinus]